VRQVQGRLDHTVVLAERVNGVWLGLGRVVGASLLQVERQIGLNPRAAFADVHALALGR
jgi:hypothetical protein